MSFRTRLLDPYQRRLMVPGSYNPIMPTVDTTTTLTLGSEVGIRYVHGRGGTGRVDRIGLEVTQAGAAGCLVRLGIRRDNGYGYPGELLLDAGTIDGTVVGFNPISIDQFIGAGVTVWLMACGQVDTTSLVIRGRQLDPLVSQGANGANANRAGYRQTGITGALPATFTAQALGMEAAQGPKVVVRAA